MQALSRMGMSQRKSSVQDLRKKVSQAQDLLTDQDYFQKAFLKPIEVTLRNDGPGLAQGLRLVLKDDVSANKFKTTVFETPNIKEWASLSYEQMIGRNYDNLFSLMKSNEGIQLAICVCMYSQDKKMLKNTLAGIAQNIDLFVKGGLSTDKIAVICVMDGIEKVDPSIVEYFDELERQSSIMLCDESEPMGLHDFLFSRNQDEQKYDQQVTNINKILFTEAQLFERQEKRFSARVRQYQRVRELIDLVEKLKTNKGLTYDILDPRIQQFFIEVAKQRRKEEYGQDEDQLKNKDKQFFIDEYANDVVKSRPIIMEALIRARQYCEDYIKSRESLSIVNYFRTSVFIKRKASEIDQQNGEVVKTEIDEEEDQCKVTATRMNLFLCTKYKNAGKLSSHNWFFNGFCKQLVPKYSILLDVGLRPQKNALFKMYKHMLANQNVGGVCGYMGLRIERVQDQLGYNDELNEQEEVDCVSRVILKFVDIQRAQQMEYHFAHLIDKSFESQFKFIHVLPGAFSAYNMQALHANNLLEQYFKSLQQKINNSTIVPSRYTAFDVIMKTVLPDALYYMFWPIDQKSEEQYLYNENIYLAEDRILCMGIHKNGKDMAFLPDAYAWVDPIKNVHTLLGQRKRWINGSFFAFDKVKAQLSMQQQCEPMLRFQMYYLSFMNMLAYVAPALFMFTVSIAIQVFRTDVLMVYFADLFPTQVLQGFVYLINFIYTMTMSAIIFYSMHLTNKHKKFIPYIYATSMMLGVFAVIVFVILSVDIFRGSNQFLVTNEAFVEELPFSTEVLDSMRWIIIAIILLYAIPVGVYVILYKRLSFGIDMLFGAFSFLFFSPTYLNILNIYALARINDISWGTKGLDADVSNKNANLQQTWNIIRLLQVGKYLFWNIIAGLLLLTLGAQYVTRFLVTFVIMLILGISLFIKVSIGIYYLVVYFLNHRIDDPPEDAKYNEDSRINDFYAIIRPKLVDSVSRNLAATFDEIQIEMKNAGPRSVVMWGGKSKVLQPGKKKENLKKGFQALQKLNASRIIRKDPAIGASTEFKGRYKLAADKNKYKKNRGDTLSSDKSSDRELNAAVKPAKSKDKFKKYRDVIQIKTSNENMYKEKPAASKDKYRKKSQSKLAEPKVVKPDEDEIGGDEPVARQQRSKTPTAKDKYKKAGKK